MGQPVLNSGHIGGNPSNENKKQKYPELECCLLACNLAGPNNNPVVDKRRSVALNLPCRSIH